MVKKIFSHFNGYVALICCASILQIINDWLHHRSVTCAYLLSVMIFVVVEGLFTVFTFVWLEDWVFNLWGFKKNLEFSTSEILSLNCNWHFLSACSFFLFSQHLLQSQKLKFCLNLFFSASPFMYQNFRILLKNSLFNQSPENFLFFCFKTFIISCFRYKPMVILSYFCVSYNV